MPISSLVPDTLTAVGIPSLKTILFNGNAPTFWPAVSMPTKFNGSAPDSIAGQPSVCGGEGASKREVNHSCAAGWKDERQLSLPGMRFECVKNGKYRS
ncbi:hypothetical protein FIM12_05875 [SAR202 cluster bacterium AD-804-J14_MRT_500m]|nr:hypothetical protein [SAR202 cluster bacterium AD-804-J14_MRT_500m]